jgi:hypothetical protein
MNFTPFVRPATPEELEPIKAQSDLTASSVVWAWPNGDKAPDLAVIRQCLEVDPMWFSDDSGHSRRGMFAWAILNLLKAQGTREIYFNVDTEGQEPYVALLEKIGAKRTTNKPQFRFKLEL